MNVNRVNLNQYQDDPEVEIDETDIVELPSSVSAQPIPFGDRSKNIPSQKEQKVGVRLSNFLQDKYVKNQDQLKSFIEDVIQQTAQETSLKDLIERLVTDISFRDFKLMPKQTLDSFEQYNVSELIVRKFVDSYADAENIKFQYKSSVDDENQKDVIKHLIEKFLDQNPLNGSITFYEYLNTLNLKFPDIRIAEILEDDLFEDIKNAIESSLERIVFDKYKALYQEDKAGFVLGFLTGRVVRFCSKMRKQVFDRKAFRELLKFVDQCGDNLENINGSGLYNLLYEESRIMSEILKRETLENQILQTNNQINNVLFDEENIEHSAKPIFVDPEFNVQAFYQKYIVKELMKFNSFESFQNLEKVRLIDLMNVSSEELRRTVFSLQHLRLLKNLVELNEEDPKEFFKLIRYHLGYNFSPRATVLNDQDVQKNIEESLKIVKFKIKKTIDDALNYRELNDPIRVDCQYLPEILDNQDLSNLMKWILYPEKFKQEFNEYKHLDNQVIAYQARVVLLEFLNVNKTVNQSKVKDLEKKRMLLEDYMKQALNIEEIDVCDVEFRLLQRAYSNENKPEYELVVFSDQVGDYVQTFSEHEKEELVKIGNYKEVSFQGERFRAYPMEKKRFTKVKMNVPFYDYSKSGIAFKQKEIEALIYTARDRYIDTKDILSLLQSETRGKQISDENRWMLAFPNQEDENVFKEFLYGVEPYTVIKTEDSIEKRVINKKNGSSTKSASSKGLKSAQSLAMSQEFNLVDKRIDGLNRYKTMLETQIQTLPNMLIANLTDYSKTAHAVYRAQRTWALLDVYFNPRVWGDKFQEYKDQGYNYQSSKGKNLLKTH